MINNYFKQLAARNNIGVDTNLIKPQIKSWLSINDQKEDPFDIFSESDQINQSLFYSNKYESKFIPKIQAEKEKMQDKSELSLNQNEHENTFSSEVPISEIRSEDKTKLISDKSINNNLTQANINPTTNKDLIFREKKSNVFEKNNNSKIYLENNIEEHTFDFVSKSLNESKGDLSEKKETSIDDGELKQLKTIQQEIKINKPLKVFRTELLNRELVTNEINSKEKPIKLAETTIKEINPSKSPISLDTKISKQETKLIIGKLTVEVIQPPREKILLKEIPQKQKTSSTQPFQKKSENNSGLKVQFGLGQI
ncbi:MAG: hypothetical protein ACM34M_10775 [Ignavibacteria bacterium]